MVRVLILYVSLVLLMHIALSQDYRWTRMSGSLLSDYGRGVGVDSSGSLYISGTASGSLFGLSILLFTDVFISKYSSDGSRSWTVMFGSLGYDYGNGLAVDTISGSVYVTGQLTASIDGEPYVQSGDIFLVKYTSSGSRTWTRMIGTNGNDQGYGVAVESTTGAVYVSGYVQGSIFSELNYGGYDIILSKFASNGTRIWTKVVGTTSNDVGYGCAVDSSTGAVFVTGTVSGSIHGESFAGGSSDIILMKYASNGTRVWTKISGTSGDDGAYAVAVDSITGAVYITGFAEGSLHSETFVNGQDLFLMKYASDGTRAWTRMVGTSGNDEGYGIVVDSKGAVFVTGRIASSIHGQSSAGGQDIILMEYASNGTRSWTRLLGSSGSDYGYGVSLYGAGPVYVVGSAAGSVVGESNAGSDDILVASYSNNQFPSVLPTIQPTRQPTGQPTGQPSGQPTSQPSCQPSVHPTSQPSMQPTRQPSAQPTSQPSIRPTSKPSVQPSSQPTRQPTGQPSALPTSRPSLQPSGQPTSQPSCQPSVHPTSQPSRQPSLQPTNQPTREPTGQPTMQPSSQPSGQPTSQPSFDPTAQPSTNPSSDPTGQPTTEPTTQPSSEPTSQYRTACQYRKIRDIKNNVEYTDHRCFAVPSSKPFSNRRLSSKSSNKTPG